MKWTESFLPTLKEQPKNIEIPSHALSIRVGLIRQSISGVHTYLPLGWKVCLNIINIIREEMNKIGAQEILLPALSTAELWEKTGRLAGWGAEIFRLKDRGNRELCLSPTHEEPITEFVSKEIHSYKELPCIFYQIQTKFRDEPRPRGGVLRAREFIMKDSYSFDVDEASFMESYAKHRNAYEKILTRCGLSYKIVDASSGLMGSGKSEEFMVSSPYGEDSIVTCKNCEYSANKETGKIGEVKSTSKEQSSELKKVHTPVKGTVDEISKFLNVSADKLMKSILYFYDSEPVFVLLRGNHEISMDKLNKIKIANTETKGTFRIATPNEVKTLINADVGYISPVSLPKPIKVLAANSLKNSNNLVTGANENLYHFTGVDIERDVQVTQWEDIEIPDNGDPCPKCNKEINLEPVIELGHIFDLGKKYSTPLGATVLDKSGQKKSIYMGSYGIGIERIMAAAIETNNDPEGIIWPMEIAPFKVIIIPLNISVPEIKATAEKIYSELSSFEPLFDDRDVSAGIKFKDANLIGIPIQIIIGENSLKNNEVEIKTRDKKINTKVNKELVLETIQNIYKEDRTKFKAIKP
ncbi:MAG: proline--tRNA ligase [bacterium]|nr:proline--tRNA ligase [bacterium]